MFLFVLSRHISVAHRKRDLFDTQHVIFKDWYRVWMQINITVNQILTQPHTVPNYSETKQLVYY